MTGTSRRTTSPQFDDPLAGGEGLDDRAPVSLEKGDQGLSAAIADADPEQPPFISRAVGEVEEILVLGHDDPGIADRVLPDLTVGRLVQAEIEHVDRVVALGCQPARKREGQLIVDEELQAAGRIA